MNDTSDDWTPRKAQTVLKAVAIILAYSAVIVGYLALVIRETGGAP